MASEVLMRSPSGFPVRAISVDGGSDSMAEVDVT